MLLEKYERYPKELFEGRLQAEGFVIGCLLNDPLLLDDVQITKEHFATKDGQFYFYLIDKLKQKGITQITQLDIINNFNDRVLEEFENKGGINQLEVMKSATSTSNFDKYADDLFKYNMYVALYDMKYNLLEKTTYEEKEVIPIELFKKLDCETVVDFYEGQISRLDVCNIRRGIEECELAIDDDFIQQCIDGEANGVPFDTCGTNIDGETIYAFNHISQQCNGYLRGTLNALAGYSSTGKSTMMITMLMALISRGEKVLIISNEQKSTPFKQNLLMFILTQKLKYYKITKKNLTSGKLTEENMEYIKKAQQIYDEEIKNKIFFVGIPSNDMSVVRKKIREYVSLKGVTCFVFDTFKAQLDDIGGEPAWQTLIRDSRTLHELSRKYDIIGIITIQLAIHTLGQLFLNANCLSQSKAIKEILENLLLMRNIYPEELDSDSRYYCKPFRYEKNENGKWIEKDIEIDKHAEYRMIFIDKCRSGQNSISGNYAVLIKFNGQFGTSHEYCLCRPKNGNIGGSFK